VSYDTEELRSGIVEIFGDSTSRYFCDYNEGKAFIFRPGSGASVYRCELCGSQSKAHRCVVSGTVPPAGFSCGAPRERTQDEIERGRARSRERLPSLETRVGTHLQRSRPVLQLRSAGCGASVSGGAMTKDQKVMAALTIAVMILILSLGVPLVWRTPPARASASAAPTSSSPRVPVIIPAPAELETKWAKALKERDTAWVACEKHGGIVSMGFDGPEQHGITCLKPSAILKYEP
jgi:hypothetical protein